MLEAVFWASVGLILYTHAGYPLLLWLLSLVGFSVRGQLPVERSLDVELAGLYWHFVDVVWIVIFTVVYLVPSR